MIVFSRVTRLSPFVALLLGLAVSVIPHLQADSRVKQLSAGVRLKIFDQVWETIRDKYYDEHFNGVDWDLQRKKYRPLAEHAESDSEFYSYLKLMVGELRDSHTRIHTPRERESRQNNLETSAGFELFEVEGRSAVVEVSPLSEAARKGIRPGMILAAVNGIDIGKILARARALALPSSSERAEKVSLYRTLLSGPAGTKLELTLLDEREIQHQITVELMETPEPTRLEWKRFADGTGYIKFNRWEASITDDFRKALERLRDSSRLVIDLRGNAGGSGRDMYAAANLFFTDPVSFGEYIPRKGKRTIVRSFPMRKPAWSGSIAILLDESSRSSSELFAAILRDHHKAVIAGRQSCGCVLGISSIKKLKGGGELTVSEIDVLSPGGQRLERTGVVPDIDVPWRLEDLRAGRDAVLDAALDWLARHRSGN